MHDSEMWAVGIKPAHSYCFNHISGTCVSEGTTYRSSGETTENCQACPPLLESRPILASGISRDDANLQIKHSYQLLCI